MRDYGRYHWKWLSGILMLLLLASACTKSSGVEEEQAEKPKLKIYVFAPDRPIVTRADNGDVDASEAENKIHNLHVWVFENHTAEGDPKPEDDGKYVGHISLNNIDISQSGSTVTMELSDNFALLENKPKVDVYVVANVTAANCGLTLSGTTTRDQLVAAMIGENYFGVTNLIKTVPADGLPMSGVMKNKRVTGNSPVYQVSESEEDGGQMANVKLVRAVSKIRFVFSLSTSNPDEVKVNNITLGTSENKVLPKQEYLFVNDAGPDEYVPATQLVSEVTTIHKNTSPASYSWDGTMSGQDYERLIQTGIDEGKLSDLGTFYLRESDKPLAGTISYTISHTVNGVTTPTTKTPLFTMKDAGDFSRNHTWIVYSYFVSSGDLIMGMVEVKGWSNSEVSPQYVYNW